MDKHQKQKPSKKPKRYNAFAKFSGIAVQMGMTIYLGHWLGEYLDEKYNNQSELYTKTATLVAVFISIYLVIKQVTTYHKD